MATFREVTTRDSQQQSPPAGLRRGFAALGAAIAVWSLPYLVPGLERFRPWTRKDTPPFSRLLRPGGAGPAVAESSGGVEFDNTIGDRERDLLALDRNGARRVAKPSAQQPACQQVAADDYQDVTIQIEDPHRAMRFFYEALAKTACRLDGAITRIGHWGDSAIVRDGLTSVAREHFQRRFGDAGHGFILAALPNRWYVHHGVTFTSTNWTPVRITHAEAQDGRYGYGGTAALGSIASSTFIGTAGSGPIGRRVDRFVVSFLKGPEQGALLLRVDGGAVKRVSAAAGGWQDAVHKVSIPDGPHRLAIKVAGPVRVYGASLERTGPGVIYDSLGILGCFDERLLALRAEHWREQLVQQNPHLMVIMFGGNTLSLSNFPAATYTKNFERVVKLFRQARPDASCLVMSPLDHGERYRGSVRSKPALKEMIAVQRAVAFRNQCAYYSLFDAMGGEGTMGRWSRSKPRLVSGDLAHASMLGNRILGTLLHRAVMAGFHKHLQGSRRSSPLQSSR